MNIIEKLGITPGPWEWEIKEDFDAMVDMNGDEVINDGSSHGEYHQCIKGDSPNAFLIAAAPEMLEALEKIIKAQYNHKGSLLTLNVAIFDARKMLIDKLPEIKELIND